MHYNRANSYLFVNGTEIHKFKAKDSETVATPLCVGNISNDFSVVNMKMTGFYGYVYNFSVDYDVIAVDDVYCMQCIKRSQIFDEKEWHNIKCLHLLKNVFFTAMTFLICNVLNSVPLKCVSMNNQECKIRPKMININSNEPLFYPYSIEINKCSCSCSFICFERKHIKWHQTCKCRCRLDATVCNYRQRWNNDKCRCECKELIDKGRCDKGFIWNPSNCECECECDKSCSIGKYLDYKNCKYRKDLVG